MKTLEINGETYVREADLLPEQRKPAQNVAVEIPLPDGWMCMHVGRLVERDAEKIVLVDAAWIGNTGRRNEFFAGKFDDACEIEPLPDDVCIELPAAGAVVTDWTHELLREEK